MKSLELEGIHKECLINPLFQDSACILVLLTSRLSSFLFEGKNNCNLPLIFDFQVTFQKILDSQMNVA